jgi:hypothetical protein
MTAPEETKVTGRPKEVAHDETPSGITDHAFEPKGEWWTLCRHCNFAESAHRDTTLAPLRYHSDDVPDD